MVQTTRHEICSFLPTEEEATGMRPQARSKRRRDVRRAALRCVGIALVGPDILASGRPPTALPNLAQRSVVCGRRHRYSRGAAGDSVASELRSERDFTPLP